MRCSVGIALLLIAAGVQAQQQGRVGSIGTGWTYQYSDQGAGERESINGWYLRPSVRIAKGLSVYGDLTVYYGANRKGSLNSHGLSLGLSRAFFRDAKVRPSIFARVGDSRSSNAGVVGHSLSTAIGASFEVPLNRRISLSLTPGQWIFSYPHGDPRNNYNLKAGLTFPIARWH